MAPRKRKPEVQAADDAPAVVLEKRVTRASIKRTKVAVESEPVKEDKARKKGGKKKEKEADMVENGKEMEVVAEEKVNVGAVAKGRTVVIEHCKQCNSFKTRAIQVKNGLEKGIPGIAVEINPEKVNTRVLGLVCTVTTHASAITTLENDITLLVNPRRGCFEIRDEGGEKFISLLDMKRPFGPMKALDMEKVIVDIIDKIKA